MATQKKYTVKGKITNQESQPLQGLTVRAFDLDANTAEKPLGKPVQTDDQGVYTINYTDKDFRPGRRETGGADIVVRVYNENGELLDESPVRSNAEQQVTIDLKIAYTPGPRSRSILSYLTRIY